ncbi:MAG: hypothetical protein NC133_02905 [Prevotella sp.]|nr:hypothetical protein [Prevotella sp.]
MFLPDNLAVKLRAAVEQEIKNGCCCFTMGTHGDFDQMALTVCRELKAKYPAMKIEVVLTSLAQIAVPADGDYHPYPGVDTIMYEIETLHPKQRITASNRQMIDTCDTMICYAVDNWHLTCGTQRAVHYARQRGLKIINLAAE